MTRTDKKKKAKERSRKLDVDDGTSDEKPTDEGIQDDEQKISSVSKKLNKKKERNKANKNSISVASSSAEEAAVSETQETIHDDNHASDNEDGNDAEEEDEELIAATMAWAQEQELDQSEDDLVEAKTKSAKRKREPSTIEPAEHKNHKREKTKRVPKEGVFPSSSASGSVAATSRDKKNDSMSSLQTSNDNKSTNLSLYVNQIAFTATEFDIRQHFLSKGCIVTSVRMVYDHNEVDMGNNADMTEAARTFRGVAFVDVVDEASYQVALDQLHRSTLLGRTINVRPTKTKSELVSIVQRTQEIVAHKIQQAKQKLQQKQQADKNNTSRGDQGNTKRKSETKKGTPNKRSRQEQHSSQPNKKARKAKNESKNKNNIKESNNIEKKKKNETDDDKRKKTTKSNNAALSSSSPSSSPGSKEKSNNKKDAKGGSTKTSISTKISKQQRNRRAAILLSYRNKKK